MEEGTSRCGRAAVRGGRLPVGSYSELEKRGAGRSNDGHIPVAPLARQLTTRKNRHFIT